MNNLTLARMVVFYSWFVTALIVLTVFAAKIFWPPQIRSDFSEIYPALKTILAFILPPLSMAFSLYITGKDVTNTLQDLDDRQTRLVIVFSMLYHVLFNAVIIGAIWFHVFETPDNISKQLEVNASAAGVFIGFLSFLLIPVNTLVMKEPKASPAKPQSTSKADAPTPSNP